MRSFHGHALGWHRDLPDHRDHTRRTDSVDRLLSQSAPLKKVAKALPAAMDLRRFCSPIEDQGQLGSCTANAAVGMLEYYENRAFGRYLDASRLFLYKVTRKLIGFEADDGAFLRDTMKAMVLFGVPPESYWPYVESRFNDEPTAFCYSYASSYKAIDYYRLDPAGTTPAALLQALRASLAAGLPSMFGFSVFSSMPPAGDRKGLIPFPAAGDSFQGGHAVLAVGYDDAKKVGRHKGALLIRNSWGVDWGEKGYGWLPYEYIEQGLADDFWTMVRSDFVDSELFKA